MSAAQSVTWPLARMPAKRPAALTWCRVSVALMRALEGTQPTLTQVPPRVPWPISATLAPCSAAVMAAENPADPAPITARSYELLPLPTQQSCMSGPRISLFTRPFCSPLRVEAEADQADAESKRRQQHVVEIAGQRRQPDRAEQDLQHGSGAAHGSDERADDPCLHQCLVVHCVFGVRASASLL